MPALRRRDILKAPKQADPRTWDQKAEQSGRPDVAFLLRAMYGWGQPSRIPRGKRAEALGS